MTQSCRAFFGPLMAGMLGLMPLVGCGDRGPQVPAVPHAVADSSASDADTPTSPTTGPLAAAEPPPKPTTPATRNEAAEALDLRKLPVGDELSDVDLTLSIASYNIKKSPALALDDVRARLRSLGFVDKPQTGEPHVSEEFAQASFTNGDFRVECSITQQFDDKTASSVRLMNMGNVDSRTLPPLPDSKLLYGGIGTTIYVTPANVADTIEAARQVLAEAGWQEYGPANAAIAVDPDHRTLSFKQNAIDLSAFIGVAPAQNNQTTMQYGTSLLNHELPAPPDATSIEFDDYQGLLRCKSGKPMSEVADFYRAALETSGWRKTSDTQTDDGTRAGLTFESADKASLMAVEIKQSEGDSSLVQLQEIPASSLAETEPETELQLDMPEDSLAPAKPPVTLAVSELPIPKGAKAITESTDLGAFSYKCDQSAEEILDFARARMHALGWKENDAVASVNLPNATVAFDKEDATVMVVIGTAGANGGSILNFVVNDVTWAGAAGEEMPAEAEPAAAEPAPLTAELHGGLPIPSDNQGYMTGGTGFRSEVTSDSASDVPTLVDFYRRELTPLKWEEQVGRAEIAEDHASLFFTTSEGPGSLELKREGNVTHITLAARNEAAARKAGILPKPNMARVVMGNVGDSHVTLTINKQKIQLKPQEGAEKPDGPALDLPPGKYKVEAVVAGKAAAPQTFTVGADEVWGIMVFEEVLPLRMY